MELTICCPKCNSENITRIDNSYKCKKCGKLFDISSDTIRELMNWRNNYVKK